MHKIIILNAFRFRDEEERRETEEERREGNEDKKKN